MKKLLFFILTIILCLSSTAVIRAEEAPPVMEDLFFSGQVVDTVDEFVNTEFGIFSKTQELRVEIKSGEQKGQIVEVTNTVEEGAPAPIPLLSNGDRVVVGMQQLEGDAFYYISDMYRLRTLWWTLGLFLLLAIVFAKWYGVRSIFGLCLSFFVVMWFIVPQIAAGANPLLVSGVGTLGIAATAIFVAHGWKPRTVIAFISTIITLLVAFGLSWLVIEVGHMFGVGTEEAYYLRFAPIENLNLQWLLLGGILIGMLGVLDDVTTAQAAAVEEIHNAHTGFSAKELYARGISVGREHIISLVNTLVLAYTGASLPLLLLFEIYQRPAWVTLNSELVMEEVIRMLVGSIALVLAVPLTTYIAAVYFGKLTEPTKDYGKKIHSCSH